MRFGRVEGFVERVAAEPGTRLRLTVTLETSAKIETVRDELLDLAPAFEASELSWLADQYTQETIGDLLASQGWEAVGASSPPERQPDAPAKSATYTVRNLGQDAL